MSPQHHKKLKGAKFDFRKTSNRNAVASFPKSKTNSQRLRIFLIPICKDCDIKAGISV